jgi:hypothetical protein
MTFDRGRVNDTLIVGLIAHGYQNKRWTEGKLEYYDDKWKRSRRSFVMFRVLARGQ